MKKGKVWAVLGAGEGLGPATIRYLLSREQTIFAVKEGDPIRLCDSLKVFTGRYGPINILIDNLAYNLIDGLAMTTAHYLEFQIEKRLREVLETIRLILPYMVPGPEGQIISIPPKPYLFMDSGEPVYDERADAVQQYCSWLKKELLILDNKITYITYLAPKGIGSLWRE
ncbi:MAG: hypothetical protein P4L51_07410 [Puia sp.]|nr:hypothetical protein [Puia sp.]